MANGGGVEELARREKEIDSATTQDEIEAPSWRYAWYLEATSRMYHRL